MKWLVFLPYLVFSPSNLVFSPLYPKTWRILQQHSLFELFENLQPGCKPIAAKSCKFSKADQKFIEQEVQQMLEDDIIQPFTSHWREPKSLLLKQDPNTHPTKQLCVDFSQNKDVYTELDPLARFRDVVGLFLTVE